LTFFLWLTLAVAGAGNIAAKGGFVDTTTQGGINVSGNINNIFRFDNLLSFILGIAMLMAGFEAASEICSSSFVSSALGKAKGSGTAAAKMAAGAATYVGSGAGRWIGRGAKAAGGAGIRELGGWAEKKGGIIGATTKRGRAKLYREMAKKSPLGEGIIGRFAGQKFDVWAEELEKGVVADVREPMKKWEGVGKDAKFNQLQKFAHKPPGTTAGKREAMSLLQEALADPAQRKKLEAAGILDKLWGNYGKDMKEMYRHDADATSKIKDFETSRPDITGKLSNIDSWEKVKNLDDSALADERVIAQIKKIKTNTRIKVKKFNQTTGQMEEVDDFMGAWEAIQKGQGGAKKKNIAEQTEAVMANTSLTADQRTEAIKGIGRSELLAGMTSSKDLSQIAPEEIIKYVNADAVGRNEELARYLLASQRIGELPDTNRDSVTAAVMEKAGGFDVTAGTVKSGQEQVFASTLAGNPQLIGLMSDTMLAQITGETKSLGLAMGSLTPDALKKALAQIKKDPQAKGSQDLQRKIFQIMAAAKSEADPNDLVSITQVEDMFETQIASTVSKPRKQYNNAQRTMTKQTANIQSTTQRKDEIAITERPALVAKVAAGDADAQFDLDELNDEDAMLTQKLVESNRLLADAQAQLKTTKQQLVDSLQPKIEAIEAEIVRLTGLRMSATGPDFQKYADMIKDLYDQITEIQTNP